MTAPLLFACLAVGGALLGLAIAAGPPLWRRWRRPLPRPELLAGAWVMRDVRASALTAAALGELARGEPPAVHALFVGRDHVALRLGGSGGRPPGRWRPDPSGPPGQAWSLSIADLGSDRRLPAGFPAVVTLGRVQECDVLVDLRQARGLVTVDGDETQAVRLLEAIAFELVTNPWSREVTVLLAGFGVDVVLPAPGRVRRAVSAAEAVTIAEAFLRQPQGVLVVIVARPPSAPDLDRLAHLAEDARGAVVVLCTGKAYAARWVVGVGPDGQAQLGPLGLRFESIAGVLATLRGELLLAQGSAVVPATFDPGAPSPGEPVWFAEGEGGTGFQRTVVLRAPAKAEVRVLGPLEVQAPGAVPPDRRPFLAQLVAAAAILPGGLSASLLAEVAGHSAADVVRHLHNWLGAEESGAPRLRDSGGGWRLSPRVRVDWQLFLDLAGGSEPSTERARLTNALGLVRGELFDTAGFTAPVRLALDGAMEDLRARSVHCVRRAAELAMAGGDVAGVEWALRRGLVLLPRMEGLWRTLLLFQSEHQPERVGRTVEDLRAALASMGGEPDAATSRLLARLGWQQPLAPAP
ncbi:bacterial transcriptional activator domain-containing protein [Prauserella cavernicola]|uniref:Bacterial transcriptional activator domain-containing protein n=1 Tax=Prauserella cavernicola TaxID=2800127 RepID=A0A934QQ59_9PSEU|nr:bacterial transcriptional activator domain-containing protein [Prauserella cavernicola]MBK1783458.1 bacterial transcriptional activator domain-containing protein [Prauserella cavernicola]